MQAVHLGNVGLGRCFASLSMTRVGSTDSENTMAINAHGALYPIAAGLHGVDGAFGWLPFGRRMTVVTLPSGSLALHSPIRMDDAGMAALDALGAVGAIIVPNPFHGADAPWYAARYPAAAALTTGGALRKISRRVPRVEAVDESWSDELTAALEWMPAAGMKVHEYAFFHPSSRTLILTDLVFNMGTECRGLARLLLRLNKAYGRFGPSRTLRWFFAGDIAELRESVAKLDRWDYDRVIMAHGRIVESEGKAMMQKAFAEW